MNLTKRSVKAMVRFVSTGWSTGSRIESDLKNLGVRPGGAVLVHSSLSSLGDVRGGAASVIKARLAVLGPGGTLVMPAHTWECTEQGLRNFDSRKTPSCVGLIAERFRKMPRLRRSLHPTHSVAAIGPPASILTDGHETCSTPCGVGTPYEKLLNMGGQVLFLGVNLDSNTTFHAIEAIAGAS